MYLPTTSHCNFLKVLSLNFKQPCFRCFIPGHILIKIILSPSLTGDLVSGCIFTTSPLQHPAAAFSKTWQLRVPWTKTPCWDFKCCKSLVSHLLISVDQPSCVEEKMWRQNFLIWGKTWHTFQKIVQGFIVYNSCCNLHIKNCFQVPKMHFIKTHWDTESCKATQLSNESCERKRSTPAGRLQTSYFKRQGLASLASLQPKARNHHSIYGPTNGTSSHTRILPGKMKVGHLLFFVPFF